MKKINRKLKAAILRKFNSQSDFAEFVGTQESVISQIINGRRSLKPKTQQKWADILGCDVQVFNLSTGAQLRL